MKVAIKAWQGETVSRWYVADATTGDDYGYLQTYYKIEGYGTGSYARHRAAKCDFGERTPQGFSVHGNEAVLGAVLNRAESGETAVDNELGLLSQNGNIHFWGSKAERKQKARDQKSLTIDIAI